LPVHQIVAVQNGRKVRLVRDVEEGGQRAGDECDDVQLPHRQGAGQVGDRNRQQDDAAADVGGRSEPAGAARDPARRPPAE
jgi:hypothetical protein